MSDNRQNAFPDVSSSELGAAQGKRNIKDGRSDRIMVNEANEQPEFDLEDVMKDLIDFRFNVSFHLTAQNPLPTKFEAPLWQAYHLVADVIEELKAMYKYEERGLTYFTPSGSKESESGS